MGLERRQYHARPIALRRCRRTAAPPAHGAHDQEIPMTSPPGRIPRVAPKARQYVADREFDFTVWGTGVPGAGGFLPLQQHRSCMPDGWTAVALERSRELPAA